MSREPPSGKGPDGQLRLGRGDVVGERWRLDEFLKGGGMGRVWRATDLRLLEPVAVKLMDPAGLAAEGARERFFREAQAAARLRGPNVVQVLDFDVDPGTHIPYLAMELLHGEDLAERLARGKLGFTETLAILADVCSAITRAHRLEIVHRDLKPANVFIVDGEDPVCKVLDFGIVKLSAAALAPPEGQLTLSGAALGTVSYMSPEQIADAQRVDHRADLWSIGVLAYECLTGRRPFRSDSLLGLVHEVCYGTPTPPSRLAEVPAGFDRWFARATHRDRDRRFASARELHDALKALTARPGAGAGARDEQHHEQRHDAAQSWVSDANQIDIGALKELTFKSPVVREFLDGASRHFVSGSKGLGKTLLLTYKRALLGEQYQVGPVGGGRRQAVQFIPEGRPYLDLMGDLPSVDAAQIDRMSKLDECKRLWSFSFRLSILSYHPALIGDLDELSDLPRRLRALLEGRPVEPTLVLKELLALSVRQLSQVLDAMEGPLERRLRALHNGVFIFIDKLDQALRRLPRAAWVHMQAGMIEAAWDLMNANRHVKIFATIRDEAFSGYESDIKSNLYGATSSLRYAKHELRELLEKLTYYYEGLPLYDFVLVDQIYTGARSESPFDFLVRHTLGRPRDLVILASEISRNRRGLDARAFIRVVQDTSAGLLVSNIFDEMRVFLEVLSDRDRRARFLALLPHDVLTHDDVAEIWCTFHGVDREYFDRHGRDADDVYHPFRELYECGLLGVLEDDNLQRFRQPHDGVAGSRHELPRSRYYLLHPALRALLERLAGAGRFRPLRHVLIGHGEPWPAHWHLLVDVERELVRRHNIDADTTEAIQALLERLAARLAGGDGLDTVRRELAGTAAYTTVIARLERGGFDDLYLTLVDLFTPHAREPEPSTAPQGRVLRAIDSHAHAETLGPTDRVEVAMLLVDIIRSTRLVLDLGDTNFVDHLNGIRGALRGSSALRFLKGTGDGYLAVYDTAASALDAARALRAEVREPDHLRLVIHSGPVRLGDQDVFGSEVHRLFRLEAIEPADCIDGGCGSPLRPGRITISRTAWAHLPGPVRGEFSRAGAFRLKGFDEPEEVWVEAEDVDRVDHVDDPLPEQ